jgi:hypothetical protein
MSPAQPPTTRAAPSRRVRAAAGHGLRLQTLTLLIALGQLTAVSIATLR